MRFWSCVVPSGRFMSTLTFHFCVAASFSNFSMPFWAMFQKSLELLVTKASLIVAPSGALWTSRLVVTDEGCVVEPPPPAVPLPSFLQPGIRNDSATNIAALPRRADERAEGWFFKAVLLCL